MDWSSVLIKIYLLWCLLFIQYYVWFHVSRYSVFLSKTKTKHSALKQLKIELKTILAAKLVDYKHPLINCVSSWLFFTVFIVTLKFHLKHLFYLWSTEKINSPQSKGHTSVMPLRDLNHRMYLMNCHYRVESKLLKMQICPH